MAVLISTDDILCSLQGSVALVGNAMPRREFGALIDSYDTVIRFDNFRTLGIEKFVGSKTTCRCTAGWHDIEHRDEHLEFSPFCSESRESGNLAAFNEKNKKPVVSARFDVHPLIPETEIPSTALAVIQLLNAYQIEADLFGFDGVETGHYGSQKPGSLVETHAERELAILLERQNVTLIDETYPYESVYEFCHKNYREFGENVGLELVLRLNKVFLAKKILELGAGNGELSSYLDKLGNEVTAFEVSPRAFEKIQCTRKVRDSALGLAFEKERYDLFFAANVLEHLIENDIRLVIRQAARLCGEIFLSVSTRPSNLLGPNGEKLHLTVRQAEWWTEQVSRYFDVQVYPGLGEGQLVLEGTLRRRFGVSYAVPSSTAPDSGKENETFFIKRGYKARPTPEYFEDSVSVATGIIWQPDVYTFAGWLGRKLGCTRIVDIGCGWAEKLFALHPEFNVVGLDYGTNLSYCRSNHPQGTWIEADFERLTPWPVGPQLLMDSIVICSDVIEHLVDPVPLLTNLKILLEHAPAAILSTPERELTRGAHDAGPPQNPAHTREWSLSEFVRLLRSQGFAVDFAGLTRSNDRDLARKTLLTVLGNNRGRHLLQFAFSTTMPPSNRRGGAEWYYRQELVLKNGDVHTSVFNAGSPAR